MPLFKWLLMKNETVDVGQPGACQTLPNYGMSHFLHLYSSTLYKTIMKWPSVQLLTLYTKI